MRRYYTIKKKNNKRKTYKKIGGNNKILIPSIPSIPSIPPTNLLANITMQHVIKEHEKNKKDITNKINMYAKNIASNMTNNIIALVGKWFKIDINDPSASIQLTEKIEHLNKLLVNPKIREELKQSIASSAEFGTLLLQVSKPFLEQFVKEAIDIITKSSSQIGTAIVKIGLNTAEEIPGVGILVGTIRSLSSAGDALLATTNATNEILTKSADTTNAIAIELKQLLKEKEKTLQRIQNFKANIPQFNIPISNIKK